MANVQALQRQGWYLSPEGIEECTENARDTPDDIIKTALDWDLKQIGERHLAEGTNRAKLDTIDGPFVLQIQKVRNVTAPKDNEESNAAPQMLKLTLTDGHSSITGLEMDRISRLSLNTPPGTKILLTGKVPLNHGFLMLNSSNCKILGGVVVKLVENWELKRSLAKHTRAAVAAEGGPPEFVPFGRRHRIPEGAPPQQSLKRDNFKSLDTGKEKAKEGDKEFEAQRQASIKAALKGGGEGKKVFGGSKSQINDKDVARIVEMGFNADQAAVALRECAGSVEDAINTLLKGGGSGIGRGARSGGRGGGSNGGDRGNHNTVGSSSGMGRGSDRGDRGPPADKDERPGRGRKGRDRGEDSEYTHASRPSGPATLFDYLTPKMPVAKEEPKKQVNSDPAPSQVSVSNNVISGSDNDGHNNTSSNVPSRRGPTNLPPRLQKQQQRWEDDNKMWQNRSAGPPQGSRRGHDVRSMGYERGGRGRGGRGGSSAGRGRGQEWNRSDMYSGGGGRGGMDRGYDQRENWNSHDDMWSKSLDRKQRYDPNWNSGGGRGDMRDARNHGNWQQEWNSKGTEQWARSQPPPGRGGHGQEWGGRQQESWDARNERPVRSARDQRNPRDQRDNRDNRDNNRDSRENNRDYRENNRDSRDNRRGGPPVAQNMGDKSKGMSKNRNEWNEDHDQRSKPRSEGPPKSQTVTNHTVNHSEDQSSIMDDSRQSNTQVQTADAPSTNGQSSKNGESDTPTSETSHVVAPAKSESVTPPAAVSQVPPSSMQQQQQQQQPPVVQQQHIVSSQSQSPQQQQPAQQPQMQQATVVSSQGSYPANNRSRPQPTYVAAPPQMTAQPQPQYVPTQTQSYQSQPPPAHSYQQPQQTYTQTTYQYTPTPQQYNQQVAPPDSGVPLATYSQGGVVYSAATPLTYTQAQPVVQLVPQMQELSISNASYVQQEGTLVAVPQQHNAQQIVTNARPNSYQRVDGIRPARIWKPGDYCMAKYYLDNKFYPAIVTMLGANGQTCVVNFPDYGNSEEVYMSDVKPIPKQAWNANSLQAQASATNNSAQIPGGPVHGSAMVPATVPAGMMMQQGMYIPYTGQPAAIPTTPTDQPYQGSITNMEFYSSTGGISYTGPLSNPTNTRQQPRPQQIYIPTNSRQRPM